MDFTHQVAIQVLQEGLTEGKNAVCSPVSIQTVLSMLAIGAGNSTLEQLLNVLGHGDLDDVITLARKLTGVLNVCGLEDDGPVVSSVNGLWLDQQFSLKIKFKDVLSDVHNAEARVVDFTYQPDEVVKEVNSWAEQETKGIIMKVLTRRDIGEDTVLLLANALHFKASWRSPFHPNYTCDNDFNLLNGDKVRVPFMNKSRGYFYYGTFQQCQVLRMPYTEGKSNSQFSMYIFLPNEEEGLPNLINNIKIDQNMFEDQVNLEHVLVNEVSIPKYSFESHLEFKKIMKQLGLTIPFDGTNSDFSGMVNSNRPVYVDEIIQKCRVNIDEKGTEAAAVTIIKPEITACFDRRNIKFVANHPFMFMIRDDISESILFVGTMLNPE